MAKQKNLTLAVAAATSSVYDVVEGNVVFLEEAGLYQASWPKPRSPKKTITRNIPASQVLAATLGEDGSVTFLATSAVVADLGECEITGTTEQGLLIVTDEDGNEHHVNPSALESESESEGEAAPAKAKPKAAGKKKAAEVEDEDDEDDEPAPKAKGKKKAAAEDLDW